MGYKAQHLLYCLALQSRDASVHSLQRMDGGLNSITLFLTELPLASLNKQNLCFQVLSTAVTASVWWTDCSGAFAALTLLSVIICLPQC